MDADSYLQEFRQNYFLGNYSKNLDLWKESTDEQYGQNSIKIDFLIARSLISQTKLCQKIGLGNKKDTLSDQFKQITNLVNENLSGMLLNTKSKEQQREDFYNFAEDRTKSQVHYLIYMYMGLQAGELETIMLSDKETDSPDFPFKDDIEIIYLQFQAFLQGNNLQGSKQKLSQLMAIDREDVLALLAQVYYNISLNDENTAIQYLNELKDRFGDSPFIINLKISVLMKQKKFPAALQLAQTLHTLLTTKENVFNKSEFEICLTNLITLSEINNKPSDEYIKALYESNQNSLNIQRAQKNSEIFDDLAQKMSQKQ